MSTLQANTFEGGLDYEGKNTAQIWICYDQVNNTINDSFGVDSVSDDSLGLWTITFTETLADANYAVACSGVANGTGDGRCNMNVHGARATGPDTKSTTQLKMQGYADIASPALVDVDEAGVQVFGGD